MGEIRSLDYVRCPTRMENLKRVVYAFSSFVVLDYVADTDPH